MEIIETQTEIFPTSNQLENILMKMQKRCI